jgi:hypothetical protein
MVEAEHGEGLIRRMFDVLARAFGGPEAAAGGRPAPGPASAPASAAGPRYTTADSPEFAERLRALFRERRALVAGGVHVIGLQQVRAHFGDKWPAMREKVQSIARRAIEHHLAETDLFTGFGESAFVIVFAGLTAEAARVKCALIADEIARRVFGTEARPDIVEVATSVIKPEGEVVVDRVNLAEMLKDLVSGHGSEVHEVATGGEAPPPPAAAGAPAGGGGGPEWTSFRAGLGGEGRPEWQEVKPDDDRTVAERERYAAELLAQLPPREQKLYSLGPLGFVYRPMWLVRKKITSAHICVPIRVSPEGTMRIGGAALLSSPGSSVNMDYDLVCLGKAREDLTWLASHNKPGVLVVPVHYTTIADLRRRGPYVEAARKLDVQARQKLVFEVISIPAGVPEARLTEVASVLRQFSPTVIVRVRLDNRDFTHFAGQGFYAAGADITNFSAAEAEIMKAFDAFAERASKVGLRSYVHGLRSTSLVSAAVCAGFDYVDGDPVTTVRGQPGTTTPFNVETLYGALRTEEP